MSGGGGSGERSRNRRTVRLHRNARSRQRQQAACLSARPCAGQGGRGANLLPFQQQAAPCAPPTCSTGPISRSNAARLSVRHLHLRAGRGVAGAVCRAAALGVLRAATLGVRMRCATSEEGGRRGCKRGSALPPCTNSVACRYTVLHLRGHFNTRSAAQHSRHGGHAVGLAGRLGEQRHLAKHVARPQALHRPLLALPRVSWGRLPRRAG